MIKSLSSDETSTITVLLERGRTVREISKFTGLNRDSVAGIARTLNIAPASATQKRAKALFELSEGLTYAEVANKLQSERLRNEGETVHYLTVATWVANYGWSWGGSEDGVYSPDRTASGPPRSKYTLRMSSTVYAEVNSSKAIASAAEAAWDELSSDRTLVVAVAVVKGAASQGVTDIAGVKAAMMKRRGEAIRSARAS